MVGKSVVMLGGRSLLTEGVASLLQKSGAALTMVEGDQPDTLDRLADLRPDLILVDCQSQGDFTCDELYRVCADSVVVGLSLDSPVLRVWPDRDIAVHSWSELIDSLEHLARSSAVECPHAHCVQKS